MGSMSVIYIHRRLGVSREVTIGPTFARLEVKSTPPLSLGKPTKYPIRLPGFWHWETLKSWCRASFPYYLLSMKEEELGGRCARSIILSAASSAVLSSGCPLMD